MRSHEPWRRNDMFIRTQTEQPVGWPVSPQAHLILTRLYLHGKSTWETDCLWQVVCVCPGKPCPHKDGNMQNYGPCVGKFLICMFGAVRLRSWDNKPQIILFIWKGMEKWLPCPISPYSIGFNYQQFISRMLRFWHVAMWFLGSFVKKKSA